MGAAKLQLVMSPPMAPTTMNPFPLAQRVREALARRAELARAARENDEELARLGREAADVQRIPLRLNPDQLRRSLDRGEL